MRLGWLALLLTLTALPRPARACATAPPPGVQVQIAEESAIIVWDAAAKREHFIRRASFRAAATRDFGFLVPTPDKPELAEVPDRVFDDLEWITRPEVVEEERFGGIEPTLLCGCYFLKGASKSAAPAWDVRVLATQHVAGYDAVVLEANSAGALSTWLKDHGYAERDELRAWLGPYVAARWKITAFKIAGDTRSEAIGTSAVRMTFTTDRPFYPYREPSDQRENLPASARSADRLLRVFFLGGERVEGTVGAAHEAWPGKAVWSSPLDPTTLREPLPFSIPPGAWLTTFEDRASPRPGTDDLFFAPSREHGPVKRPPVVNTHRYKVPLPLDVLAAVGVAVWIGVRRRRRRRAATEA